MKQNRGLVALLLAFLFLGSIYSLVTPIFEAGDEVWHYPFVQWLAAGHGLPVQDPAQKQLWEQEGGARLPVVDAEDKPLDGNRILLETPVQVTR